MRAPPSGLPVQFSSVSQSCPTLCNPMDCSTPGFPVHHQLPELAQTHVHELVMPSNHLILCRPLLLLPSIFPSIKVFSNESVLPIRWPKYWSFSFSINPSNEYSGLISFRIDWFDLLAVQGTLKSLLQHHCSKASILWCSAFFMVQLSHPYMTTGKTILHLIEVLKVKVKLAQSYQLCDPMDYTVNGILQGRILEWVAYPFSSGSSQPRNQTRVSCIASGFFIS